MKKKPPVLVSPYDHRWKDVESVIESKTINIGSVLLRRLELFVGITEQIRKQTGSGDIRTQGSIIEEGLVLFFENNSKEFLENHSKELTK